ncbi:AIPR family protein [Azospirillum argentinense]
MSRYNTLVQILDKICLESPSNSRRYRPDQNNPEALDQSRARAFIHLYLKVKFGLSDFLERERYVTDDANDGGIDAYYIDKENRTVHVIQSKFRTSATNFEEKEIAISEFIDIDIDRIAKGEQVSKTGQPYNGKIRGFQEALEKRDYPSQYKFKIVLLANLKDSTVAKRLYSDYTVEVFNFLRTYKELCFPVVAGTLFTADSLHIHINLDNVKGSYSRVSYEVKAFDVEADVTLIFAPTREIGRVMSKYRNSILTFNPRSFLGLKGNEVNADIEGSIKNSSTNEFALYNNGITIIADQAGYSDTTGRRNMASLELKNPQIINGGQTAFTMCAIYDEVTAGKLPISVFDGKEVLLKVISIDPQAVSESKRVEIIEKVSKATNFQTSVVEADRRSNDEVQIKLQEAFYEKYGLFYERKKGEFHDGLEQKYISKEIVVDRDVFLRVSLALDFKISETRANVGNFFEEMAFKSLSLDVQNIDKYAFAYACHQVVMSKIKESRKKGNMDKFFESVYGNALKYGRFAVAGVAGNIYSKENLISPDDAVMRVLDNWMKYEDHAESLAHNQKYFSMKKGGGWVSYFKGETINNDVKEYFENKELKS